MSKKLQQGDNVKFSPAVVKRVGGFASDMRGVILSIHPSGKTASVETFGTWSDEDGRSVRGIPLANLVHDAPITTSRKINPAPRKYRGKYPRRIQSVSSAGKGETVFQLNDGSIYKIPTRELITIGYVNQSPKPGEDFDYILSAISALPKTNPAKRAPSARVGKTRKQYVSRPSQAPGHKAPSKRLKARRKLALVAPKGYFPNPLEAGVSSGKSDPYYDKLKFYVQHRASNNGKWIAIAAFEYREDAFTYAKKLARDEPGFTLRVMKDE